MLTGIAKRRGIGFTKIPLIAMSLAVMMTFLWSFGAPWQVHACSCPEPGSPTEELEEADAVFAGRVVSIQYPNGSGMTAFSAVYVGFEVSTVWKGTVHEEKYIATSRYSSSCGFAFKKRREYIVYAYGSSYTYGGYGTGWCSRTALLRNARSDLDALGHGHAPRAGMAGLVPALPQSSVVSRAWVIALAVVAAVIAIGGVVVYSRVRRGRTAIGCGSTSGTESARSPTG